LDFDEGGDEGNDGCEDEYVMLGLYFGCDEVVVVYELNFFWCVFLMVLLEFWIVWLFVV